MGPMHKRLAALESAEPVRHQHMPHAEVVKRLGLLLAGELPQPKVKEAETAFTRLMCERCIELGVIDENA